MEELDLSDFFQTKAQAHDFSLRLAAISEKVYETGFNLESTLMQQFGIRKKDAFISFLRNSNLDSSSNTALKAFLDKIQQVVAALPVVTLTIAVEPNEAIIKAISDWFILNLKKQVLFDIRIDPALIAGTTLTYGGKYLDLSVKPLFDKVLQGDAVQRSKPEKYDATYYKKYNATPFSGYQGAVQQT